MLTAKEERLLQAIEAQAADQDIEIITLEIIGAKRAPIIRVYIDGEDGVSFNELSSAQGWIGDLMDRLDPFPGAYTLEVSSPGIDRPLRTPEHFQRFIGEEARIRTTEPLEGRSNFTGTILAADGTAVTIDDGTAQFALPFDRIRRANLIGKIELS